MPCLFEIDPVGIEKLWRMAKVFKIGNVFSLFQYYFSLEKDVALHLNKQDTSCHV